MGIVVGADAEQAQYSNCATDVMTVTNQQTLPNVCGTLTGEHGTLIQSTISCLYTFVTFITISSFSDF